MSNHDNLTRLPEHASGPEPRALPRGISGLLAALIVLGAAAFVILLTGSNPVGAWQIFLVNFLFWSGVAIAGVMLAAIFQVTNARWALQVRRLGETCASYLPISLLLFVGIWFGRRTLLPWIGQPRMAVQPWLTVPFFFFRELAGLLLLYSLSLLFFYYSVRSDTGVLANKSSGTAQATASRNRSLQKLAVSLLILYALIYSLVAWDFVMSLDPSWSSTLFGAFYFIGNLYSGLAALAVLAVYARWRFRLESAMDSRIFHNLGKLLFAFSLFWTYLFWSQYLVIWYGNLPQETPFVLLRTAQPPWNHLAITVLILNFVIPFFTLLFRRVKGNPNALGAVALFILIGMWLERYLLIVPSLTPAPANVLGWADALVTLGFLSSFLLTYLFVQARMRLRGFGLTETMERVER